MPGATPRRATDYALGGGTSGRTERLSGRPMRRDPTSWRRSSMTGTLLVAAAATAGLHDIAPTQAANRAEPSHPWSVDACCDRLRP